MFGGTRSNLERCPFIYELEKHLSLRNPVMNYTTPTCVNVNCINANFITRLARRTKKNAF